MYIYIYIYIYDIYNTVTYLIQLNYSIIFNYND